MSEPNEPFARPRTLWLPLLLLLCALAYLPGLWGPFVFDDTPNLLTPLGAWLNGDTGWREIVFGNNSGLMGRPLSMLTFLANAAVTGLDPMPFKATNLVIHLLCGVVLYALLLRLLPRDPWLKQRAPMVALLITGVWLLHPIQVSTVLYVVQRMAQLSALFVLGGLLAYVYGRQCLEEGRARAGRAWLFIVVPALAAAAVLCKESGALLPLLCGVIELAYFRPTPTVPRPRAVNLFFLLAVLLPGLAALTWYGMHPEKLLGAYDGRLFTLGERLLSQPRALMDYMRALLLPSGPSLGIYTDDFVVSHGWFDPPTTALSIIGLAALIVAAAIARTRVPAFFAGIGLYLAGHVLESSVFPLEMYFEHRNYLPSAGFFLAVVGLGGWGLSKLLPMTDHPERTRRSLSWGAIALVLLLAGATWARAGIWSSSETIAVQGLQQHPHSVRANIDVARVMQAAGRYDEVQATLDHMATLPDPQAHHIAAINSVALQCGTRGATTEPAIDRLRAIAGARLELGEMLMMENLVRVIQKRDCPPLDKARLASIIVHTVDTAPQPARLVQLWRNRFYASKLYASAGELDAAQRQLEMAWGTGYADPAVGAFLVQVQLARHDFAGARRTLPLVRRRVAAWDRRGQAKMAELERTIEAH